ncbi:MAG TPA: BTAD domain-containing putative transcriptional regulator [Gaiellaceae bacterium]|nr:BTAD domain-containing putative transcriptional regulator [Gaiellaceae bacterium]
MEFKILGPLEVLDDGRELNIGGAKQRALLAALLLNANRSVTTDSLIEALWGERPPQTASKALQVYVSRLRKALSPERIVTTSSGYRITVLPEELDLERFQMLVGQGNLDDALELWRGAPLQDLAYEPFVQAESARLEELRLSALEQRIDGDLASAGRSDVIPELEGLVRAHPHRERFRGQLMLALYRAGRQADALDAYKDAYRALSELGLEPSNQLRYLQQSILNQDSELAAAAPDTSIPLPPGTGALPVWLTPLHGRSRELSEIGTLLRGDVRLLTLTGPGGTGKTRLAAAVATDLAPSFDDGVRFVALAPLADPELVVPTISRALGIPLKVDDELAALRIALAGRNLLLVLDNYEHLLEAAPVAGDLAAAVDGLSVLVTSRAPLHVDGERVWPVDPLELPAADAAPPPDEPPAAVALFTDRARAAQPGFAIDGENATAVAEICVRLDGLPLAIELAAARVNVLPPTAMVGRLDHALPLLAAGPRDAPERQRTLENAIGWSYDLLSDRQRELLRVLSVFAGSWTLSAAEAVGDASLDDVAALVEISLLRSAQVGDEQRFSMLRTIREFGQARLAEAGETDAARLRHAEYMLEFARAAKAEVRGPNAAVWLARLEVEHDNMRAALTWSLESGNEELALELAAALWQFWYTHAHFVEGRRWLRLCLESVDDPEPDLLAGVLGGASRLAFLVGDLDEARSLAERSLDIVREQGDLVQIQDGLGALAIVLSAQEDIDGAEQLRQEALDLARQSGDRTREALHILNLGYLALVRGDVRRAEPLMRESVEAYREIEEHEAESFAIMNLALLEFREDHFEEAVRLVAVSLETGMTVGSKQSLAYGIECVAVFTAARERASDAARLLACAERLRDEIGLRLQPYEQELHDRTTALVQEALDDVELANEREHGSNLTADEGYAYALAVCESLSDGQARRAE